jgi:collagen type VI alpha
MINFTKTIVEHADVDSGHTRIGIVVYSTSVTVQFHLNTFSNKAAVLEAIDGIKHLYGNTNTADGLRAVHSQMFTLENGDRHNARDEAIVITDGVSNMNSDRVIPEAETLRSRGIHVYAIGVGLTETKELDGIASKPIDKNRFSVKNFDELHVIWDTVFAASCQEEGNLATHRLL